MLGAGIDVGVELVAALLHAAHQREREGNERAAMEPAADETLEIVGGHVGIEVELVEGLEGNFAGPAAALCGHRVFPPVAVAIW